MHEQCERFGRLCRMSAFTNRCSPEQLPQGGFRQSKPRPRLGHAHEFIDAPNIATQSGIVSNRKKNHRAGRGRGAAGGRSAGRGGGGTEGGWGWMGGELRPKPFRQEIILRLKFIAGLVFTNAVCACTPPHYSVGV